jgi:hypothetical protein
MSDNDQLVARNKPIVEKEEKPTADREPPERKVLRFLKHQDGSSNHSSRGRRTRRARKVAVVVSEAGEEVDGVDSVLAGRLQLVGRLAEHS